MTKQAIKEIKRLLKDLDSNIENDENASFEYWKASKLIHEHLINIYTYNSEKKDFGYILYRKEAFKIFNDNLYYVLIAIQQKNIQIKSFMIAYALLLENFMRLKSFLKDLRGEYITTTPKKNKQFEQVLACTADFLSIVEKHVELIEENAKKL